MPPRKTSDWYEWKNHVLVRLDETKGDYKEIKSMIFQINNDVQAMRTNHATLRSEVKLKSGLWGSIVGFVSSIIASLFIWKATRGE